MKYLCAACKQQFHSDDLMQLVTKEHQTGMRCPHCAVNIELAPAYNEEMVKQVLTWLAATAILLWAVTSWLWKASNIFDVLVPSYAYPLVQAVVTIGAYSAYRILAVKFTRKIKPKR